MVLSKKRLILITFVYLVGSNAFAFSFDFGSNGSRVKWKNPSQVLYFHSTNSSGISNSTFSTILGSSVTQWNSVSPISLSKAQGSGIVENGHNDVYFSTSSSLFSGAGVLAVTQVSFKESTGEIIEADIAINDNYSYSTSAFGQNYIGDVLTHEIGHFLGLGHSEVSSSSMVFELGGGQNTISSDDILGIKNLYTTNSSTKISGKVVAKEFMPVFGSHVEFISQSTGRVLAGVLSDSNGDFSVEGIDENIFIAISPTRNASSLSSIYKYVRSDFCNSSTKYVKSIVQGCQKSNEGYPLKIKPSTISGRNLGNLSIRCNSGVPVDYMLGKGGTFDFDFLLNGQQKKHGYVGFFSATDVLNAATDTVQIDLTSITIPNATTYLKLNVSTHEFYSPTIFDIRITDGLNNVTNYSYQVSSDGKVTSDRTITLLLSSINNLKNNFTVEVIPTSISDFVIAHPSYRASQILPGVGTLGEIATQYLVTSEIVDVFGASILSEVTPGYTDESACLDGKVPFQAASLVNTTNKTTKSSKAEEKQMMACGSISTEDPPYNGPTGMLVGLILCLMVFPRKKLLA